MDPMPLRYSITDWHQLPNCLSNNSRDLHLNVTDFIQDSRLSGLRIAVNHIQYGTLFAYIVDASGTIITDPVNDDYAITNEQLLAELAKFGFNVEYVEQAHLSGGQLDYLMTLQKLGYDKLRLLDVSSMSYGSTIHKTYVVAFNIAQNPNWLLNTYCASSTEFTEALMNGSAINLTEISKTHNYTWNWLTYVANIDDIITDNAGE